MCKGHVVIGVCRFAMSTLYSIPASQHYSRCQHRHFTGMPSMMRLLRPDDDSVARDGLHDPTSKGMVTCSTPTTATSWACGTCGPMDMFRLRRAFMRTFQHPHANTTHTPAVALAGLPTRPPDNHEVPRRSVISSHGNSRDIENPTSSAISCHVPGSPGYLGPHYSPLTCREQTRLSAKTLCCCM